MSVIKKFEHDPCAESEIKHYGFDHPYYGRISVETCCNSSNLDEHCDFMSSLSCSMQRQLEVGVQESFICMRKKEFRAKKFSFEFAEFLESGGSEADLVISLRAEYFDRGALI